jgi:hypothetical protein
MFSPQEKATNIVLDLPESLSTRLVGLVAALAGRF